MELAGLSVDGCAPAAAVELPAEHRRVLEVLRPRSPQTIDIIASHMGASIATVAAALGRLSLDGAVEERADGWVSVSRAR
jgi:predicted Rossmann fold nucleotide-binding protein DprA/Smf involved in DNA uptake